MPAAEPVADFTDLAVAFESATTYAVASSRAVVGAVSGAVGGAGRAGGAGTGSQGASGPGGGSGGTAPASAAPVQAARPVSNQWRCPWPSAAVAADLYRQSVTVRVVISADGTVERATALRDPGHGFGAAAESCARRERFIPARDAGGQPMRSTAPVRVAFER